MSVKWQRRKIPLGRIALTGSVPSRYAEEALPFESNLERKFFMLLDAQPGLEELEAQPFTVSLRVDGQTRRYTPDVLVSWRQDVDWPYGARTVAFEVKPLQELKDNFDQLQPKLRAARQLLRAQGIGFRVVTERTIDTPRLANAQRIIAQFKFVPGDLYNIFDRLFAVANGPLKLQLLLDALTSAGAPEHTAWAAIYHWIGIRYISCDLSSPVTGETVCHAWFVLAEEARRHDGSNLVIGAPVIIGKQRGIITEIAGSDDFAVSIDGSHPKSTRWPKSQKG